MCVCFCWLSECVRGKRQYVRHGSTFLVQGNTLIVQSIHIAHDDEMMVPVCVVVVEVRGVSDES